MPHALESVAKAAPEEGQPRRLEPRRPVRARAGEALAEGRAPRHHARHAVHGHPKATNAWRLYELVAGHKIGAPEIHEPLRAPPPVPTTSIFSRTDGVVAWPCCVEKEGPHTENIEVESSHLGMGMNPAVLYAIADRLAQPAGKWRPFDRRNGVRAWVYRDPRRRGWF